jgi:protein-arginine kinase activator protein McsA
MEEIDLEKMTVAEVRDFALKEYPAITGVEAMEKEALMAAIQKARGEAVKETDKKEVAAKVQSDKKELKKQIRLLKSEKDKLLHEKDKKALARVRKKIKKLRRLTQRAAGRPLPVKAKS